MNSRSPASNQPQVSLDFLRGVPLFAGLEASILEEAASLMQSRAFGSGMTLFHQDMPGTTLYLMAEGAVRVYSIGQTGQEFTYYIYGPGDIFGELSLLGSGYHSATCITMMPIKTWLLSRDSLFLLMQKYPVIMRQLLGIVAQRVRTATRKSEAMAFQDVQGRLVYELLNLEERISKPAADGTLIDVPLTQNDLASMVGATRESVNKVLAMFRSQNLIKLSGASITIVDRAGLERIFVERGR